MEQDGWIEHRRDDGELVGWMRPEGDGFVVIDLLGRAVSGPIDWFDAEALLDELGLRYLADPYLLDRDGTSLRVRITEVSTRRIRVKRDDYGDITAPLREFELAWPMPDELRPLA